MISQFHREKLLTNHKRLERFDRSTRRANYARLVGLGPDAWVFVEAVFRLVSLKIGASLMGRT